MSEEARLEPVASGLAPVSEGWFVVNARDAAWLTNPYFTADCIFQSDEFVFQDRPDLTPQEFPQLGFALRVLPPGKSLGFYHSETDQEDFLVLQGECTLVIEDEERALRAWDFVHCPPGTGHVFVGTGERVCVILCTGARSEGAKTTYRRSEAALRHSAGAETETSSSREAYGGLHDWRVARPKGWDELPWAR